MDLLEKRTGTLAAGLLICLASTLCLADFRQGLEAYSQGDFAAALEAWQPLAEAGQAEAQFNLGLLYYHGKGVEQDREVAAAWYRKAADQGYARAQYDLAAMCEKGDGIEEDLIEAHLWFKLAGKDRYEDARKRKRRVANRMDPFQIAEADLRARQWNLKRRSRPE